MHKRRWIWLLFLAAVFLASHLTGAYLKVAVLGDVRSLNPYFINTPSERTLIGYLYETLLTTQDGMIAGNLAKTWDIDMEDRSIVIEIHDRVFHDGHPVTAEDVAFSYNMTIQKRLPMGPVLAFFVNAKALDTHRVQLQFREMNSSVLSFVPMAIPVVPKHLWEVIDNPRDFPNTANPVGTGAMSFVDLTPQTVTLSSFPYHPDAPQHIDGIIYFMVQDQTMGFLGLVRGDYDYLSWGLDSSLARQIAQNPNRYPHVHVFTSQGSSVYQMLFNHRKAPFDSVDFRKALQYAINYEEMIQRVFLGYAELPSKGIVPPMAKGVYDPSLGTPSQDLEKARAYLEKSGYQGERIRLLTYTSKEYMELAEYIKLYLSWIGVRVEIEAKSHETIMTMLRRADFDLTLTSYILGHHPEMLYYYLHTSRGVLDNEGHVSGFNYGGISIPEIDDILDLIWTSFEAEEQKTAFYTLQSLIVEHVPMLPLLNPKSIDAYSTRNFENWVLNPLAGVMTSETLKELRPRE